MTVGDILVSINQASLETMLPLAAVKTSADIERYYKEGYSVGITANEFAKKFRGFLSTESMLRTICWHRYIIVSLTIR